LQAKTKAWGTGWGENRKSKKDFLVKQKLGPGKRGGKKRSRGNLPSTAKHEKNEKRKRGEP